MNADRFGGDVIFDLRGLGFSYSGGTYALRGIDLQVDRGERLILLGANGSGKTTLLKILDALYFPTEGTLDAFGEAVTEESLRDPERVYRFRRRVGYVFQDPDVQLFSPSVWEEVAFGPLQLGLARTDIERRVNAALALMSIEGLAQRAPHRLSGGEQKRVALASVLSLQPEVLLLDEPTESLDPRTRGELLDFLIERAEQGLTMVVATHDLQMAAEMADRVVVLAEDGTIAAAGAPREILADTALLLRTNLVHVHAHRHRGLEHTHPHSHDMTHEHEH